MFNIIKLNLYYTNQWIQETVNESLKSNRIFSQSQSTPLQDSFNFEV